MFNNTIHALYLLVITLNPHIVEYLKSLLVIIILAMIIIYLIYLFIKKEITWETISIVLIILSVWILTIVTYFLTILFYVIGYENVIQLDQLNGDFVDITATWEPFIYKALAKLGKSYGSRHPLLTLPLIIYLTLDQLILVSAVLIIITIYLIKVCIKKWRITPEVNDPIMTLSIIIFSMTILSLVQLFYDSGNFYLIYGDEFSVKWILSIIDWEVIIQEKIARISKKF